MTKIRICLKIGAAVLAAALLFPFPAPADLGLSPEAVTEVRQAEAAGRWDEVVRRYREYLEKNPLNTAAWVRLADVEADRGRLAESIEALEKAVAASPDDPALAARLSQHYAVADRPAEALEAIERALELEPENREYLYARGELANWVGRPALAAESFERLLALDPDHEDARLLLARSRSWNRQLDASARAYRNYLRDQQDNAEAWLEYARVSMWQGNYARAWKLLDRFQEVSGDRPAADRERARLLSSADRPSASRKYNDPLLEDDPDDFELNVTRLFALHYGNQPSAVRDQIDFVESLRPDSEEVIGLREYVETPLRPEISAHARYYSDRDKLRILRLSASGGFPVRLETRLLAGVEGVELRAPAGSGLENIDGSKSARYYRAHAGLRHQFLPELAVEARAGAATVIDGDDEFIYAVEAVLRPHDALRAEVLHERDFVLFSPRTASLNIKRSTTQAEIEWRPDLLHTIVGFGRYDNFTDDNERWEAVLAPRRAVIRSGRLNLDLGVRGMLFGYTDDPNNGYYAPEYYQQYAALAFAYWKLGEHSGLGLIGSGGLYRDDRMDEFDWGWAVDAELTVGAVGDWTLKLSGHAMENFREELAAVTDSFQAFAGSVTLTRRF